MTNICAIRACLYVQRAKKIASNSLELVDIAVERVVARWASEIQITEVFHLTYW